VLTLRFQTIRWVALTVFFFIIEIGKRANFKIIANFLLHRIEPKKIHHAGESFENHKDAKSSVVELKKRFAI
jgi:hypothetical protein